jgi:hypothetical protein
MRKITLGLLVALVFANLSSAQAPVPVDKPVRPIPEVEHVIVIGIDGLRPDRLLLADAPVLHGLIKTGTYTMWARTTALAVTLPSFTSMMTGVNPRKHGVDWDRDLPFTRPVYSKTPTIFEMATKAGYVTAMAAGKSKFNALNKPGTITHVFYPKIDPADITGDAAAVDAKKEKVSDAIVVAESIKFIETAKPNFLFVHLPEVDTVGHAKGWATADQLAQIAKTDALVGSILAALDRSHLRESTVIIVSTDHGGAAKTHGPDDPRSRTIPWIINGPHVRPNFDLTQMADLDVRTEDTCATACWLLGLALPVNFDGHPLRQAFAVDQ